MEVFHVPLAKSDHAGLVVEVRQREVGAVRRSRQKPKSFRYENMWKSHGEYMEFVNRAWDLSLGAADLSSTADPLSSLQQSLKS